MALMFNKAKVEESLHPLVRILRHIFYKRRITLDDFSTLYSRLGKELGLHSSKINTNRNNARKALHHSDITINLFQYIILNVLRLEIVEYAITVRDQETGEETIFKSTDKIT